MSLCRELRLTCAVTNRSSWLFQFVLLAALLAILAAVTAAPQLFASPIVAYGGHYSTYAYPYSYGGYFFR
jgi:hypothetical protein